VDFFNIGANQLKENLDRIVSMENSFNLVEIILIELVFGNSDNNSFFLNATCLAKRKLWFSLVADIKENWFIILLGILRYCTKDWLELPCITGIYFCCCPR